jgi:myo-inositol-1(or 4)-monophosphatase
LDVALRVAVEAGQTLLTRLPGEKQVSYKGRADLVSDVDLQVEHQVIEELHGEFPNDGFLAEESEAVATTSGYTWIIDPLDGTRNYILGIPFFCVLIALAKDDDVLLGLTYDPVRQEMFQAVKGGGAFLNGSPISVSPKTELEDALLSYDLGYVDEKASKAIELVLHLWPNIQGTRMMGSAGLGLAYAACGRVDMYFHHHLSPWDLAASLVLVPEAGGVITDKYATPASLRSESIIASGGVLHDRFLTATDGLAWRQ